MIDLIKIIIRLHRIRNCRAEKSISILERLIIKIAFNGLFLLFKIALLFSAIYVDLLIYSLLVNPLPVHSGYVIILVLYSTVINYILVASIVKRVKSKIECLIKSY